MTGEQAAPMVSVIMPAFNVGRCIERAIRSVQDQTEQSFEIVVIDDASSDDTVAVTERLAQADSRIRLIRMAANGGPSAARNAGLRAAAGTWLALLDADDAFAPDRLAKLCGLAVSHDLDAIGDDLFFYDGAADAVVRVGGFIPRPGFSRISLDQYLAATTYRVGWREALYREDKPISLVKLVLRAQFIRQHGLEYPTTYRYCEDFLFYLTLFRHGARIGLLDEAMYSYTEPLGSISRQVSPFTRTVQDRFSIVAAIDEILRDADDLSARQRSLLLARKRATESVIRYNRFRDRTQRFGTLRRTAAAMSEPSLWFRYVRELRHGLGSRVRARRRRLADSTGAR